MSGEEDLSTLLRSMSPSLEDEILVFAKIDADSTPGFHFVQDLLSKKLAHMIFWEKEGWTLILPQSLVQDGSPAMKPVFQCKKITLNVHSSLDAVGFMAAITTRLTKLKIGVNPVSGYYHDHLFVPVGKEDAVMEALKEMAEEASS